MNHWHRDPLRDLSESLRLCAPRVRQILEAKSLEEAKRAGEQLKALSKPFPNWAKKAERVSFGGHSTALLNLPGFPALTPEKRTFVNVRISRMGKSPVSST